MTPNKALHDLVVILDLDGTLVDSAPDLAAAMNVVLRNAELPELPHEQVRHLVGHGARALLVYAFAHHGQPNVSEAKMDRYVQEFLAYYKAHLTDHTKLFNNCTEVLSELKSRGAKLAICTNKVEALTYPLIDELQITDLFDAIVCRDTLPVHKPDPAPLIECMLRTKCNRGVMIGDTDTDLNAAIAANLPCFIATFGYGSFKEEDTKKAHQFQDYLVLPSLIINNLIAVTEA